MAQPVRLRLARKKGFDLQAVSQATNGLPAVVVGRPSRWGNPWAVQGERTAAEAKTLYRAALLSGELRFSLDDVRNELAGKNLACWCKDTACHADVLLELANAPGPEPRNE